MRPAILLALTLAVIGVSALVWYATGGHLVFFFLPLLFALPLLARRRR